MTRAIFGETLLFFHPVVWWISNRIRVERELCCDDVAVNTCGDALGYARALTTLARSYPLLPARGSYAGPLRLQGTLADLLVQADMTGPAGRLALDGRLAYDVLPYGWRGTATLAGFDASRLGTGPALPATSLDGDFDADLRGSSLGTLAGRVEAELRRSTVSNQRVRSARARLRCVRRATRRSRA